MTVNAHPTLPTILATRRTGDGAELSLYLPPDLLYFQGHFPDLPILPGVVQIDWSLHFGRELFGLADPAPSTMQVKFRQVIRPETELSLRLTLTEKATGKALSFEYRVGDNICSTGRLDFAA